MAATYPRRTRPPGSTSYQYDGISPGPSSTVRIRKGSRDAIPHGAVASRVKLLQSLKEPQPAKPGSSPAPKRTREDSRSGFGRRVSRRFGNPAIQSAQPDETPRVESRHSFLGLNVVRTNHEEEHACADSTIQYSRSPGINGQIDQVADARKQYDAASPWGALSRTKSVRTTSHRSHSPDLDVLKEIDSLGNHTRYMTQISIFPSTAKKDNAGMYHHQVKPRRSKFIDSEASIATTSTIRRQNVRDLFDDYGIQRPAGLASREVSQDLGEPTSAIGPGTFCHVCSWSNSRTSTKCWRCSHQFCTQCKENPSQLPTTREEEILDHEISTEKRHVIHKSMPKPKENRVEYDPVKHYQVRPGPTPLQLRKEQHPSRKPSSPPIKFPDFYDPPNQQKWPRKMTPVNVNRQEQKPVRVPSGHRITTSVKDSPFLIADSKSPRQSLRLFPGGMRGETHHTTHNHHQYHSKHQRLVKYASTVPSESLSCDSPVCRATHHGHQPFRHAPACPRKKPRQRVPEDTENGYIADTSRVDDAVNIQSRCNSRLSRPDPRPAQQSGSGCSHLTCTSRPDSFQSQIMKTDYSTKHDIPEYVECRGYPRTGHARHGSPVSTGVVGECQHCLDDCQCEACQNTHHSVRCCVHTDHQTIVHHHHTPRKVVTIDCSEEHGQRKIEEAPLLAHVHTPAIKTHSSNAHYQHASEIQLKKNYGLETQFRPNGAPKPTPPPPVVSSHWKETTKKNKEVKEAKTTTVEKNVAESSKPKPPSKENTSTFQRTAQEHSSFETSAQPTDGTWFTIPSLHEHDHIHERRNTCPPSRKNSLEKDNHGVEMTGAFSPRTQTTPPESEKASRKYSTTLKERDQSSVQALKQQLLSHREELQKIQQDCTEQINLSAHSGVAELAQRIEQKANKDDPYRVTRMPSICSKGSAGSKKKNWKLKLVDWNSEGRKKAGEEHRLSDDEVVSEKESYKAMPSVSTASLGNWMDFSGESERVKEAGKEHNLSVDEAVKEEEERKRGREHDCVWRTRFEEVSRATRTETETEKKDLGILGVTVFVHLVGREDLVVRAESWMGGKLKADK
ncbi:hypothetical protein DL95DRAFT_400375 [Leptodontidium sp. 2 PMI_412]|nr:hypothetical protein DL95DRAFT_400375 [Leptodontidium sp. 2 PMI_412]